MRGKPPPDLLATITKTFAPESLASWWNNFRLLDLNNFFSDFTEPGFGGMLLKIIENTK